MYSWFIQWLGGVVLVLDFMVYLGFHVLFGISWFIAVQKKIMVYLRFHGLSMYFMVYLFILFMFF